MRIETELHDVNRLIQECLPLTLDDRRRKSVPIELHLQPDLPPIPLAVDPVKQALLNLIRNAEEAIRGRGVITVTSSVKNTHFIEIGITDTGRGIPETQIKNIFTPFFSTKSGGSGLGLTVAERIIHDHGGALEVESAPGRGSTFIIRLPVSSPSQW
jgi:signal transduction histidine kinase